MLKLDVAFLYDLLGEPGAQDQAEEVRPDRHRRGDHRAHQRARVQALQNNELMEAFRDRTIKIDIPYNTAPATNEIKIYEKDFNGARAGKHIAPHTIEMAAMWAILTRLEEPKKANLSLLQKLKLYNGKTLPGSPRQHQASCAKKPARGHGGHLAPLHPGQDQQRARARSAVHQPVHGDERAGEGLEAPHADLRSRDQEALQGAAARW
jgi:serine protein kinase